MNLSLHGFSCCIDEICQEDIIMVWIYGLGLDSSNKIILMKQTGCYDFL